MGRSYTLGLKACQRKKLWAKIMKLTTRIYCIFKQVAGEKIAVFSAVNFEK